MEEKLNDVFVHNLHQIYFTEKFLVVLLENLSKKVNSAEIREDLILHRKETILHVKSVEDIFTLLDLKRQEMPTKIWETMENELDSLLMNVNPMSKDFLILEAAAKSERMEISHYEALILSSKDLDIPNKKEVLDLLRANLAEEESALSKVLISMKNQVSFWKRNIH
jgi:ferritin-like metal-binding protein YciE